MQSASSEKIVLVDAHGLLYQVFHAIPEMSSPGGLPTNAVFGFVRDMLFLRRDLHPDYLVCVFDPPGGTFRERVFAEYKAHREAMPDALRTQIGMAYQVLEAMRIPALTKEDFEADDVIATLAKAAAARDIDVLICTSDKDCRQLLAERIKMFSLRKHEVFDAESLQKDWGVKPEQVIDFQMLVGDIVDNVPGVEGVGEKTASKLLQEFGTVDSVMANIERISGAKRKENLRKAASEMPRNRELVTLKTDVPVDLAWDQWRIRDWDAPRLLQLCKEWGFRSFAEQVRASVPKEEPTQDDGMVQGNLFAVAGAVEVKQAPAQAWNYTKYQLVDDAAKFAAFKSELAKQRHFAVDLETTGLDPRRADLVGLAFSWQPGEASYVAVRGPAGEPVLDVQMVLSELKPILEASTPTKVNQNIKYDLLVFRQHGIRVGGVAGDSMVAHYVLHAGDREHNMEALSRAVLEHEVIPITDLIGKKGKNQRLGWIKWPTRRVAEYSGEDADVALRLCQCLEAEVAESGLEGLYRDLEIPLIEVLAEMEFNGIRIDVPRLQAHGKEMTGQLAELEKEIYALAGHEFNIASLNQQREVLFDELKLIPIRKTGITRQPSTDQETLEELALQHPLPRKILEQRKIAKLKSTYVDALPDMVNPQTDRVHASFNQTVAATGRLSSSDPNLQNIPIRTDEGGRIRQAFIPEPGWTLLAADYSQIELRLLAHFCGDEVLRQAFADDRDIHAIVAAQVFGVAEADIMPAMRSAAKAINFGIIYGMSAFGLARRLEIPKEEASKFINDYFARYPRVLAYQDELLSKARKQGYVATILGRRRRFDPTAIRATSTYQQRNQAEREAINMEIQGSAADLIKVAMLNVYRRLKNEQRQSRLLLQIHDELVLEAPPEELEAVGRLVREEMSQAAG